MMKVELIGLPASGKSWAINNNKKCKNERGITITDGFSFFKLINIILSLSTHFKTLLIYLTLFKKNKNKIKLVSYFRRVAIMLERLGYLKRNINSDLYIDEGPMQSVWAVLYRLPLNSTNKQLALKLIIAVSVTDKVVFISVPKLAHKVRMRNRERKHPIQNENFDSYTLSRDWLAFIIIYLRKNRNIEFVQNT